MNARSSSHRSRPTSSFAGICLSAAASATLLLLALIAPAGAWAQSSCEPLENLQTLIPQQECGKLWNSLTGDWNGDGRADLITYCTHESFPIAAPEQSPLHMYFGSPNGLVPGPDIPVPGTPVGTNVSNIDLNADGKMDLIVGGRPPVVWYGHGDGTFDAPVPLDLPSPNTDGVWVTDLNADGREDLVSLYSMTEPPLWPRFAQVQSFLGDGAGGFTAGPILSLDVPPEALGPMDIHPADLNGDGRGDLVVTQGVEGNPVCVYLGTGTGSFTAPTTLPLPFDTWVVQVVRVLDWDGDGDSDILVYAYEANTRFLLYRGAGDGTFLEPSVSDHPFSNIDHFGVTVGDINGDAVPDVIYRLDGPQFRVLRGQSDGHLVLDRDYRNYELGSRAKLIDVTGDSAPDLVGLTRTDLAIHENRGNGRFGHIPLFSLPLGVDRARAGDLDGDGRSEFLASHAARPSDPDTVSLYRLSDDTSLDLTQQLVLPPLTGSPPPPGSLGTAMRDLAVRDLDADGKPELLVLRALETLSGELSVYRGGEGGTLGTRTTIPLEYGAGEVVSSLLSGDVTGDGIADALIVRIPNVGPQPPGGIVGVALVRGNGDGTLAAPTELFESFGCIRTALSDVDRDGDLDFLAYEYLRPATETPELGFTVRRGNGDGTFEAPVAHPVLAGAASILSAIEINGDGIVDVVIARVVAGAISGQRFLVTAFLGHGDGTFSDPVTTAFEDGIPYFFSDLNGDSRADLVAVVGKIFGIPSALHVFCGQSDGTFSIGQNVGTLVLGFPTRAFGVRFGGDRATGVGVFSRGALALHPNLLSQGATIVAEMTVQPPVIQPRSQGWIQGIVELPPPHLPSEIDVESIRLSGGTPIVPKSARIGDADGDGVPDLSVKFPREPLATLPSGTQALVLSGRLLSGESFEARATVRVLPSPRGGRLALRVTSALGATPVVFGVAGSHERDRTIRVYDVQGRLVRDWNETEEVDHPVIWDGRDSRGSNSPSGIYFTRMKTRGGEATARTVLVR